MEWLEVSVATTAEASEAVAARLEALGAAGAVIEDPCLLARRKQESPQDLFPEDLAAPETFRVIAYWPAGPEAEANLDAFRRFLGDLPGFGLDPGPATVGVSRREDAEWAETWKRYYHTQRLGPLVICPSWEQYEPVPGDLMLTLDPGMAFGTGTHPTTALCLTALPGLVRGGETVVDAGTGSGILALAAARLGAASVLACDVDPVACRVAEENTALNGLGGQLTVRCGDGGALLGELDQPVDLILANIVADVIIPLALAFAASLRPGGRLLASGVQSEREAEVAAVLAGVGLLVKQVHRQEGWVALEAVKPA